MPSFQINDDEREALRGLPMLAREIYVFGLRPFMDFGSGVVGIKRGVSWKSIAEELYVEPHQGIKGGEPTEKELRRALAWLQRSGLVGPNQADRRLIFELQLATRDQSARKKVGSKWADEVGSYLGGAQPSNDEPLTEEVGREVGGGELLKVGTPPVSGSYRTEPYHAHEAEPAEGEGEVFTTAGRWMQFFIRERRFQLHVVQTAKTMPLFASWVERGVSTKQMRLAMEIAEGKLGSVPDTPLYYRNFLDELLLNIQRQEQSNRSTEHEQPGNKAASGGSKTRPRLVTAGGRGGHQKAASSPVERLLAEREARAAVEDGHGRTLDQDGGLVRP